MSDQPNLKSSTAQSIDHAQSIRHKLYDDETSTWKRYSLLVTGDTSIWKLIKYELINFLFGSLPGALGLAMRQIFYPKLFKSVGRGAVFGRNLVIRNSGNITIGDRVVIDDQVVIDARGAGEDGIIIGNKTVLNRDVIVIAKVGGIRIGSNTDVGSRTMIISTGGIHIGDNVAIAGDCKIGGSMFSFEETGEEKRTVKKFSKGLVQIDDECTIFMAAMILDGVHVARGSVISPNIVLRDNVEHNTVVVAHQKLVHLPLGSTSSSMHDAAVTSARMEESKESQNVKPSDLTGEQVSDGSKFEANIVSAVYAAVDEINLLRPPEKQLIKQLETDLSGLDSLDLVNLIIETERQIEETLGVTINLGGASTTVGRDALKNLESYVREIQVILQNKSG